METLSVINLMPFGREALEMFVNKTVEAVKSGNENPLTLAVKLKYIELSLDGIRKGIEDELLREHAKHGSRSIEMLGFKVEQAEVGTRYDFSKCNDQKLFDLEEEENAIAEKVKRRKEYLKAIQGHEQLVDDDGVVTVVTPPIKSSKTSLKFTILK